MTDVALTKPGTLVRARGREWVVLPDSTEELFLLRPVGGLDEEIAGVMPAVELLESATFRLPTKDDLGDFSSGKLLRDAARLSTRAAAGPFRSFARIAAEPRPYQLVPLMMALKLDPVRMLIADDVGIGKTIEACLIARELLDRGEIQRLAVLCPPHLAEQWQRELLQKFHIDAELVLSSTIQQLERDLPIGESVFDRHKFTIVSTDFIKASRRLEDFALKCPEFVIVDEAHGCTQAHGAGRGRQQRFALLKRIIEDPDRHLVLVTATPHSGNEGAFRSLLSLLDSKFEDLPENLDGTEREGLRRQLAKHLVQRRRADIQHYLEADTFFPTRMDKEAVYSFSKTYSELFEDIFEFACEYVRVDGSDRRQQRVRYWSALALLRCVSSSPASAAATLRSRAAVDDAEEDVDEVGRRTVLDQGDSDDAVVLDMSPGANSDESPESLRKKLLAFARRAEAIKPKEDAKLQGAIDEVRGLLKDGFRPIIFCRYIDTAQYVAAGLREVLPKKVTVESVTGQLPHAEREGRIAALATKSEQYVLVCTDCLSEGINLQDHFDAVLHYDLAWNPTRHEQREGRVDRYGQDRTYVRVVTYYGKDNPIDGVILEVLIKKHKRIKSDLGVTVQVPGSSEAIAETLFQGALFREQTRAKKQMSLAFLEEMNEHKKDIHEEWDNAREREKASRSRFAHHTLSPAAVAAELATARDAIGRSEEVEQFLRTVLKSAQVVVKDKNKSVVVYMNENAPRGLRQAIGYDEVFSGRFELPIPDGELYLGRTSPVVEGLASWTLDEALDPVARDGKPVAARCGVISTDSVSERTTLVVARFRYQMKSGSKAAETMLVEEIVTLAYTGSADTPTWRKGNTSEELLLARPSANLLETRINQQASLLLGDLEAIQGALVPIAQQRAATQLEAHERVREASRSKGSTTIEPALPIDILGAYVLLPKLG